MLVQSPTPVKALLATHFFGIPQQLESLSAWCAKREITLVEDCSHVLFHEHHRPPGTGVCGGFVVSSPYKFVPSPDGGLLYSRQADRLDHLETRAVHCSRAARYCRRLLQSQTAPPCCKDMR
ncbi:MAG: DegT/DnrJ/EryC1/StrS family aminotransferase [Sulfuritalea sp.]|nr:DegT/DnrJ/EryC1/StrS family aminotransferase [Sulfuritalea sp.]